MATKNKITNSNPERHLIEGANILMREFKAPAKFLSFLTDALYWTSKEQVSYKNSECRSFLIRVLQKEVLIPWLEGGKDMLENICKGLDEVAGGCGMYKAYCEDIAKITSGLSLSILSDVYEADYLRERLPCIQTMLRVGYCVKLYNKEIGKIRD